MIRYSQLSAIQVIPFEQVQKTFASVKQAKNFITDVDKKYLFLVTSGIHADEFNMNGDYFPFDELFGESPMGGRVAATWIDKPVLENHSESRRLGRIRDTYEMADHKSIEMLDTIDQERYPLLAKDVREGRITDTSMGVIVQKGVCSICGNIAYDESQWCSHLRDYKGKKDSITGKFVGEINYGLVGLEDSLITQGMGADPLSKVREILAQKGITSDRFDHLDDKIMEEFGKFTIKYGVKPEDFTIYLLKVLGVK